MKEIVHHLKCCRKNDDETKDETWVGVTIAAAVLLAEDGGQGFGMKPTPGQEAEGGDGAEEGHHLLPPILPGGNCVSILSLIG